MGCSKVSNSEHGLLICTREDGHAPPCHWQRKLRGQKCQICGDTCEWDAPKNDSARDVQQPSQTDGCGSTRVALQGGTQRCCGVALNAAADRIRDFADDLVQPIHNTPGVCRGCMCIVNPSYPPELQGHSNDCLRPKLLALAKQLFELGDIHMGNVEAVQVLQELLAGKWRTWESPEVHARINQALEIACHVLKPHPHPAYAIVDHAVKDSPNK